MYSTIIKQDCQADRFVDFWSSLYTYPSENLYLDNIVKPRLSSHDVHTLFVWKNGMRLSSQKDSTLQTKILRKLSKVNHLKSAFSMDEFDRAFLPMGTIWRIFLLHCIQPNAYPIFDQHVYRAMQCIENNTIAEVAKSEQQKYRQYADSYLPFFNRMVQQSNCSTVTVDRALWFFGKSLKLPLVRKALGCV